MSLYNGATSGGFNQSGGGYYLITTAITNTNVLTYTAGSGSGGATTAGSFAAYTGTEAGNWSANCFGANKLLKDMGKTVVSAGRAFRKFQAVTIAASSTGGVTGVAATPGYLTAYLEVTAPNQGGAGVVTTSMVRYA